MLRRPIVEVEFFHVQGSGPDPLTSGLRECHERVAENLELSVRGVAARTGIKTVIRYFDETGSLTRYAIQYQALRDTVDVQMTAPFPKGLRGRFLSWRLSVKMRQKETLRKEMFEIAIADIRKAAQSTGAVAIEDRDGEFRMVVRDELHELLIAIAKAKDAWFTVFEPNHLFSKRNEQIASCCLT